MASSPPRLRHRQPVTRRRSTSRAPRPRTDPTIPDNSSPKGAAHRAAPFSWPVAASGPATVLLRGRRRRSNPSRRGIVGPGDSGRAMTEMTDDLSTPLGQTTERQKRRFRLPFTAMQALAVLLGLFLVAFLVVALFTDNPFGGEPVARIALRTPATDEKLRAAPSRR